MGCGMCVANCSGQAIFLVHENFEPGYTSITLPYEFLPLPQKGDMGKALSRSGHILCDAEVMEVRSSPAFDKTHLLTMKVPNDFADSARFWKRS